jgi:hypothetical protein
MRVLSGMGHRSHRYQIVILVGNSRNESVIDVQFADGDHCGSLRPPACKHGGTSCGGLMRRWKVGCHRTRPATARVGIVLLADLAVVGPGIALAAEPCALTTCAVSGVLSG